jgi:hypothetical protein
MGVKIKMKKILMSIFVLILLVFSSVGTMAKGALELDDFSDLTINVNNVEGVQGEIVPVSFSIANPGNTDVRIIITDISIVGVGLTVNDANVPTDNFNMAAGTATAGLSFNVAIGNNVVARDYTGTIEITSVNPVPDLDRNELDETKTATFTLTVNAANPSYNIVETDDSELTRLIISGQEDTNPQGKFKINNNGNVALNNVKITVDGVYYDGDDVITLKIGDNILSTDGTSGTLLGNIPVGSQEFTIEAQIPNNMNENSYEGTATISAEGVEPKTFDLDVRVEPKICKDGRVSDENLVNGPNEGNFRVTDLDVEDDSIDIGDTLEATVEIQTQDDYDIVVEAMLYNVDSGKEIIDWTIVVEENLDDDKESYDFSLEIPMNNEDINPNDAYMLYVKAYEDGRERKNCNYDSIEMELNRDTDNVMVREFTVTPSIVKAGKMVQMSVDILNIGEDKQENVYVRIVNTELGLDLSSNKFDLKQYDKSDNDAIKTFTFTAPEDAVAKDYFVEARVYFKDGREYNSKFFTLTVEAAAEETTETTTTETITTGTTQTYTPTGSFLESISGSSMFWVIGDVVLAILVIVLLVLIFRRK